VDDSGEPTHVNFRRCWRVHRATIDAMRDPANPFVTDYPPPAGMPNVANKHGHSDQSMWKEWIDEFKGGGAAAEKHYQAYLNDWSGKDSDNPTKQYFHPPGGLGSLLPGDGLWMEDATGGYPLTGGYESALFKIGPWSFFGAVPVPSFVPEPSTRIEVDGSHEVRVEARYDDGRAPVVVTGRFPGALTQAPPQPAGQAERRQKCKHFNKALQRAPVAWWTQTAGAPEEVDVPPFWCPAVAPGIEYHCRVLAYRVLKPPEVLQPAIVSAAELAPVLQCGEELRQHMVSAGQDNPTTGLYRSDAGQAPDYSAMMRASARLSTLADLASDREGGASSEGSSEGDDF